MCPKNGLTLSTLANHRLTECKFDMRRCNICNETKSWRNDFESANSIRNESVCRECELKEANARDPNNYPMDNQESITDQGDNLTQIKTLMKQTLLQQFQIQQEQENLQAQLKSEEKWSNFAYNFTFEKGLPPQGQTDSSFINHEMQKQYMVKMFVNQPIDVIQPLWADKFVNEMLDEVAKGTI